jgi:cell division protein FtsW
MKKYIEFDLYFLLLFFILIITGTWFLFSSSSIIAYHQFKDMFYFSNKQIIWHFIGIVLMIFFIIFPVSLLKKWYLYIIYTSIFLMTLVFVPGISKSVSTTSFDFKRWIQIGPFSLQPSEFVKISFLLYLAIVLERFNYKENIKKYIKDFLPMILIFLLLFLQPHYGTMLLLLIVFIILLFVSGYPWIRLLLFGFSITPLIIILAIFQPYRFERIKVWLNPYEYKYDKGYQLVMSYRAFKEGGFLGTDISQAVGHRYLTYGYTDFIYALIVENAGFIGGLFILLLFFFLFLRAFFLIKKINDPFSFLFASGIIILFIVQVLINISVTMGLIPTTGIGLPFISYGGSSLISYYIMMGIFLNLTKNKAYEKQ